jgi:hypothetical protein
MVSCITSFPMIHIQLVYHFVANLLFLKEIVNFLFTGNKKLRFLKSIGAKSP